MIEESLNDLNSTIGYWTSQSQNSNFENYDFAFFKIYVKLELYIINMFKLYSLGNQSSSGYNPDRILNFTSYDHLDNIFKNRRASYIEYIEIIELKSKYIFTVDNDPFSLVFSDSVLSTYITKFKIIRNYIAHESDESKKKYITNILDNGDFIDINSFLKKRNRRRSISNFSLYLEKIESIKNVILDPRPYF